jgi:quinol monooxygenase YgiN
MGFIQLVEGHTDRFDEIKELGEQWEEATAGKRTSQRSIITRDHTDPSRFVIAVFFDSYEAAMENSNLPETQALAETLSKLVEGPVTFHDLDVVEDNG